MRAYLDFEKPVAELEAKIDELRSADVPNSADMSDEIVRLESRAADALREVYAQLSPWQKMQVARHPQRPHCLDFVKQLIDDFTPLAGDRKFGEDEAIICGLGRFRGESICVIGQEKGATTESRLKHNFGMARPEGYRKAVRVMELADRFSLPVLAFSEGGSGGAVALATANRTLMLEHAIYSVISPEGAASILWHDSARAQEAASSMKITAQDLLRLGVIDAIVPEPLGGAHRDPDAAVAAAGEALAAALEQLHGLDGAELRTQRADKFLAIGRRL
jgi:acetyl-CoA carboxylase carboxyl transferase subunit alpha